MKFSFSTKGWLDNNFYEFCDIASDLGFQGIELHNIYNRLFTDKDGAFHDYAAAATLRLLYEKKIQIPCIDAICNIADENIEENFNEIKKCIEIASNLHITNVRLHASDDGSIENAIKLLEKIIPFAEKANVV